MKLHINKIAGRGFLTFAAAFMAMAPLALAAETAAESNIQEVEATPIGDESLAVEKVGGDDPGAAGKAVEAEELPPPAATQKPSPPAAATSDFDESLDLPLPPPIPEALVRAGVEVLSLPGYHPAGPYIDSLRNALFQPRNLDMGFWGRQYPWHGDFSIRGSLRSLRIWPGRPRVTYKGWYQDGEAPLAFLLPGLGGHYNSAGVNALAEILYVRGWHVVVISSAFNWEFVVGAGVASVPGYTPEDARDVYHALVKVDQDLRRRELAVSRRLLAGYSMGGIHSLFVAKLDAEEGLIGFDRVVSINPPVDMLEAMRRVDACFEVWREWPREQVDDITTQAVAMFFALASGLLPPGMPPPVSESQAKFLIGYNFRMLLGEMIFTTHAARGIGVVKNRPGTLSREQTYAEIAAYSFEDYFKSFIMPYYSSLRGKGEFDQASFKYHASLNSIEDFLAADQRLRVLHTIDDFLVSQEDIVWLHQVFGERVAFFAAGAHLGHMHTAEFAERFMLMVGGENSGNPGEKTITGGASWEWPCQRSTRVGRVSGRRASAFGRATEPGFACP